MTTAVELWLDSSLGRAERRAERERRRRRELIFVSVLLFVATAGCTVFLYFTLNRSTGEVGAIETTTTVAAAPLAAEFAPPTTAIPTPETVPSSAPTWVTVRVATPSFDGAGRLVTDGQDGHCPRLLPGEVGRAVVSIPADPSNAGTVVVDGRSYRVMTRATVAANNLAGLCDAHPIWPTVVVVSSQPGDARPFIEARA